MRRINEQKIYEKWQPRLKKFLAKKGIPEDRVSKGRMRKLAKMCHARKVFEAHGSTASLDSTVGRGPFKLGNNPNQGNAGFYTTPPSGSAEVYDNLFGVFIEVAANNVGMELVPSRPMSRSSGAIYIAEPVYADGRLGSGEHKPLVIQVKVVATGNPNDLVIGQTYTITEGNNGDSIIDLTFVGRHRINGNAVFRVGQSYDNSGGGGTDYTSVVIADALDTDTNNAGIYDSSSDYWGFDNEVDYVEGFTNFVSGFAGAGLNDDQDWFMNRQTGNRYNRPMGRHTGERTNYRSMGIRTWHRNFSAETVHVDLEYTTEQIQDMQMDLDTDALEFGDQILQDQLNQQINDHILGRYFALGWQHHYDMHQKNGFNLNAFLSESSNTGNAQTFLGADDNPKTIAGPSGVLPASGAISENLSTIQRRIITRLLYASGIVNTRSRRGRGDTAVLNTTFSTAVRDIRGFQPAPFDNDIDSTGLFQIGSLYGIDIYEDPVMTLQDERISVGRRGTENDPGLIFSPYILAEKISTIAEGNMAQKDALKSRYKLIEAGSYPQLNYITFTVQQDDGFAVV